MILFLQWKDWKAKQERINGNFVSRWFCSNLGSERIRKMVTARWDCGWNNGWWKQSVHVQKWPKRNSRQWPQSKPFLNNFFYINFLSLFMFAFQFCFRDVNIRMVLLKSFTMTVRLKRVTQTVEFVSRIRMETSLWILIGHNNRKSTNKFRK